MLGKMLLVEVNALRQVEVYGNFHACALERPRVWKSGELNA